MVEMEKRMNLAHRPSDRSGEDRGKSGELPQSFCIDVQVEISKRGRATS